MPRTFKFSFPRPGRKNLAETDFSPGSITTLNTIHDDSPLSGPGAKAERVLGSSVPAGPISQPSKTSKKPLRKIPSFMSVTISDVDSELATPKDGFPFPGMPSSREGSRRPSYSLRHQPSSPLLGESFAKVSPATDSLSESPSPRPHFYGSSSTLRSHYDPTKSPLCVSQQTSASSARDMALRKGLPQISSPLSNDVTEKVSPSALDSDRCHVEETEVGCGLARSGTADLFPSCQPPSGSALATKPGLGSPSQRAFPRHSISKTNSRSGWWKKKMAPEDNSRKLHQPPIKNPTLNQYDLQFASIKTNIKKPQLGTQNWVEGVADDHNHVRDLGYEQGTKEQEYQGSSWSKHLNEPGQGIPEEDKAVEATSASYSVQYSEHDVEYNVSSMLQLTSETRKSPSQGSRTIKPRVRSKSLSSVKTDLQNQSFLELSSSSDEESDGSVSEAHAHRRHRIRDSIDQAAIGDDVSVYSAQRVIPVRPKPVVNNSPRKLARASETIPPVPKIPARPQLSQRVSSMKWQESAAFKNLAKKNLDRSISSAGASVNSQSSSRLAASESLSAKIGQSSKLMAVTPEEEELLEAMRKKRASMKQDAFTEGYTRAVYGRDLNNRPKTAGPGSHISFFEPDQSNSPPPLLELRRTTASAQHTGSTERLTEDTVSFSFPEVPKPQKKAPPIGFPPPKPSPTSSFSHSELLPSTPRSRLSPLTPPLSHDSLDAFPLGFAISPSRAHRAVGNGKHDRKRTASSGIVMLDGAEQKAQDFDDDEVAGWAVDRW